MAGHAGRHTHRSHRCPARPGHLQQRWSGTRHRPGARHGPGPDDGVDERDIAPQDARDRPHLVLEPQPAGGLVQRGNLRGPAVGPGGVLRLRWRRAAAGGGAGREGGLPHRRAVLLLPCVRRPVIRPSRDEFRSLARSYSVVPVWRELLADLTTPVAAFARVVGDEPGFLLESVEHGERWGRWSFVGRRPSATLISRGGRLEATRSHAALVPPA